MKLVAKGTYSSSRRFAMEQDATVGFYLYVYEDGRCVRDHLQDTREAAIEQAFEEYGVPRDAWGRIG